MNNTTQTVDLVGIGALNFDIIVTPAALAHLAPNAKSELATVFEKNTEKPVSLETIKAKELLLERAPLDRSFGGSTFNMIRTVAATQLDLRLAYVGVAGGTGWPGFDFIECLDQLGIERRLVADRRADRAGTCISLIDGDTRALLTNPGVNVDFPNFLRENRADVIELLTRARCAHLTSLFDDQSIDVLTDILQEGKSKNPNLLMSFDPGFHWAARIPDQIAPLLKLSDLLFLNIDEFRALGEYSALDGHAEVADRILTRCPQRAITVVLKNYNLVSLFTKLRGRVIRKDFDNPELPPYKIVDSTGAGDVFAGAFLAGILNRLDYQTAIVMALRLVHQKLQIPGGGAYRSFIDVVHRYLEDVSRPLLFDSDMTAKVRVFVSHGRHIAWQTLVLHLQRIPSLELRYFEDEDYYSKEPLPVIVEAIESSNLIIALATAEDTLNTGVKRARQNVVHEIGLAQGIHNPERVLVLKEEGCELPTNLSGTLPINYPAGQLASALPVLDRALRLRGLVR